MEPKIVKVVLDFERVGDVERIILVGVYEEDAPEIERLSLPPSGRHRNVVSAFLNVAMGFTTFTVRP